MGLTSGEVMFIEQKKSPPMAPAFKHRKTLFQNSQRLLFLCLAMIMASSTGCYNLRAPMRGFGNLFIEGPVKCYRDQVWAKRAYNMRYGNCNRAFGRHFENGFCAGYESVCEGNDGFVPATPPEDYWGTEYQSPDGSKCVNAWFEGYPAGAAAAKKERAGSFNNIHVSKMMQSAVTQEKAPHVLPADVPVVAPEKKKTKKRSWAPLYPQQTSRSLDPSINATVPAQVRQVGWNANVNR